ncbi:Transmembrane anterior posterior transformation protein 1 [Bulinus truncatus]|nr:Transmembrane anterior posterior transformation protein 1 [Bulinus truncatus]
MNSFLIDRNSPIRSNITTKLRHRSSHSESENIASDNPFKNDQDENKSDASRNYTKGSESHEGTSNKTEKKSVKSKSMLGYFMTELTRDYKLEGDASEFVERRDRVYTSVNTPKNLEKFCAFGFLQCLDSILYMVTFLPLRIIVALARVLTYPCTVIFIGDRRILDGAQICDLLKGLILVISCFITSYMDMSMIYHIVRGQSIIKFYVFYNMLDVMDKLVSGFGQDVLDSLYWTAVEPRGRKREHFGTIFHLLFAIAYFVEIKGNLFKRLDKNNLCQITYSDVKERFHYLVLLLFVFIRNMKELQWKWDMAFPIIQDAAIVMLVEVIVDWIKHAFITKFNELSASSYADFALGLAQDIASSQKKHAFTNFSDQVCRRMGFTPMPLICLLFMVCTKSFNIKGSLAWLLVLLFYLCLISTKILNSIILLGWAQRLITERDKNAQSTGLVVNSQVVPKKEEKSSQPKPKNEINFDLITKEKPARPAAESSSVAVNTEPTLFTDASSFVYVAHSVQNTIVKNENLIADIDSVVIGTGSTYDFSDKKNSLDNLSDHQLSSLSENASITSQPDSFTTYSEHEADIKTNLVKPCAQIDLLLDQLQIDISPLSSDKLKEHPVDMGAVEPTTKTSAVDYNNLFESMGDSKRN